MLKATGAYCLILVAVMLQGSCKTPGESSSSKEQSAMLQNYSTY